MKGQIASLCLITYALVLLCAFAPLALYGNVFLKNKANLPEGEIDAKSVLIMVYEDFGPKNALKQSQFKAKCGLLGGNPKKAEWVRIDRPHSIICRVRFEKTKPISKVLK